MSKIFYRNVSLNEMIMRSRYIFHVKKADPFYLVEQVSIHKNEEKYPPYGKMIHYYRLVEVLFADDKSPIGEQIQVLPAFYQRKLDLHKNYYLKGLSKSPIFDIYLTDLDILKEDEFILFLIYNDQESAYQYCIEHAYELLDRKDLIIDKFKKQNKNSQAY